MLHHFRSAPRLNPISASKPPTIGQAYRGFHCSGDLVVQKAEFDQLQRKHDQLLRKYELLRLQQDKCLKRDEIDKIMDRVRQIDGVCHGHILTNCKAYEMRINVSDCVQCQVRACMQDGSKRSKRESELSRQLGERNADYRNLVGQFQGLNAERDQAVQKAAILEKDLRAQKKAVKELKV